ncbi:SDR family oxidoreductase [Rhodococcus wratislaviensis]|uniref:PRISE-like Rossmann-fold domain-containing protein n=1 Tax=Rhodococcus wratislaviensis NBRC 100605 TaxID=1219028 RepID=X0PW26_RHOWR|nr:SDR family oxidoreductase [Rhodococcus wratislaviensis]GAF47509.1 hypothetical protein RW1_041_00550 [Rhodococcus wratislaviensis NBRC 100605]
MKLTRTALVAGARGMIGSTLVNHLAATGRWSVIGVDCRSGPDQDRVRYVQTDLFDPVSTRRAFSEATDTTHVFFTAYQNRTIWSELTAPNMTLLRTTLDSVDLFPQLQHVSLMQGYKVYGAHLGPFSTPAKEDDPPHMPPEFNVEQQQLLEERQAGQTWTWSAIRPSVVGGTALDSPMNLAIVIAMYASISKELGIPLRFPGKPGAYTSLIEMTDATLLAKATVWAATTASATNQAYNIANGDMFRWTRMWKLIANFFDIPIAEPLPLSLAQVMADKEPLWNAIRDKYRLAPTPYSHVSSWEFGDFVFSRDYDFVSDTSKSRRAGFHQYVDTETMFTQIFRNLRHQRLIP